MKNDNQVKRTVKVGKFRSFLKINSKQKVDDNNSIIINSYTRPSDKIKINNIAHIYGDKQDNKTWMRISENEVKLIGVDKEKKVCIFGIDNLVEVYDYENKKIVFRPFNYDKMFYDAGKIKAYANFSLKYKPNDYVYDFNKQYMVDEYENMYYETGEEKENSTINYNFIVEVSLDLYGNLSDDNMNVFDENMNLLINYSIPNYEHCSYGDLLNILRDLLDNQIVRDNYNNKQKVRKK